MAQPDNVFCALTHVHPPTLLRSLLSTGERDGGRTLGRKPPGGRLTTPTAPPHAEGKEEGS
eukprot:4191198-Alexandrium_andersonii.AAC.1